MWDETAARRGRTSVFRPSGQVGLVCDGRVACLSVIGTTAFVVASTLRQFTVYDAFAMRVAFVSLPLQFEIRHIATRFEHVFVVLGNGGIYAFHRYDQRRIENRHSSQVLGIVVTEGVPVTFSRNEIVVYEPAESDPAGPGPGRPDLRPNGKQGKQAGVNLNGTPKSEAVNGTTSNRVDGSGSTGTARPSDDSKCQSWRPGKTIPMPDGIALEVLLPLSGFKNKVLLGAASGQVYLCNISTGSLIYTFHFPDSVLLHQVKEGAQGITAAVQSQLKSNAIVALGYRSGAVLVVDIKGDQALGTFYLSKQQQHATSLVFAYDAQGVMQRGEKGAVAREALLIGAANGDIIVFDLTDFRTFGVVEHAHAGPVQQLMYVERANHIVTCGTDNALVLWAMDSDKKLLRELKSRRGLIGEISLMKTYDADELDLLVCSSADGVGYLGKASTIQQLRCSTFSAGASKQKLRRITAIATCYQRHYDWPNIATCHHNTSVVHLWSGHRRTLVEGVLRAPGVSAPATAVCISSCGNYVAVGYDTGALHLFNLQSTNHEDEFVVKARGARSPAHPARIVMLSLLGGTNLVSVSNSPQDRSVRLWDVSSVSLVDSYDPDLPAGVHVYLAVCGTLLTALACSDGVIYLVDVVGKMVIRTIPYPRVTSMSFHPNGSWFVANASDSTMVIYDILAACYVEYAKFTGNVLAVNIDSSGAFLNVAVDNAPGMVLRYANKHVFEISAKTMLYKELGTEPVLLQLPCIVNDESATDGEPDQQLPQPPDTLEAELQEDYRSAKEPLAEGLLTLSGLGSGRLQSILFLDEVKEKSKPLEPPKAPAELPFFLPTTYKDGQLVFAEPDARGPLDEQPPKPRTSIVRSSEAPPDFGRLLLLKGDRPQKYEDMMTFLLQQSPSGVHLALSVLSVDKKKEDLLTMLKFFEYHQARRRHSDALQVFLHVFLRYHGEQLAALRSRDGVEAMERLGAGLRADTRKLQQHFERISCFIKFLTHLQMEQPSNAQPRRAALHLIPPAVEDAARRCSAGGDSALLVEYRCAPLSQNVMPLPTSHGAHTMTHLYTYFATSAPGGATLGALRCRLARGSERQYLVCLKKSRIDVYSLEQLGAADAEGGGEAPVLTATLEAHTNLLTFVEFRPPGADQSHLLALTCNFLLVLLTFDAAKERFVAQPLVSLQEIGAQQIESDVVLRVDPDYHLILFHGQKKTLKCVVLDRDNYFNISHVITMRTGETVFTDIAFLDVASRSPAGAAGRAGDDTSSSRAAAADKSSKSVLECKLLLITSHTCEGAASDDDITEFWYCGIQLFFEIERCDGERVFTAYGCSPLFGEPVPLTKRFAKFLPLKLNHGPRRSDSVLLLGSQGLAFVSFRDPRSVRLFHTDISVGEIRCYCAVEPNRSYLVGDDTGAIYLLELVESRTPLSGALRRRASHSDAALPASKIANVGTCSSIVDVVTTKIGVYSPPSALVMISPDIVYIAAIVGNCRTVCISGLGGTSDNAAGAVTEKTVGNTAGHSTETVATPGRPHGRDAELPLDDAGTCKNTADPHQRRLATSETWRHTNLGPILDFTFGPPRDQGSPPILACCGYGPEGRVCSVVPGVGIEEFASHSIEGIRELFAVDDSNSGDSTPDTSEVIMCCVFFNYSRFYKVSLPARNSPPSPSGRTILDPVQQVDWIVNPVEAGAYNLAEDARTLQFVRHDERRILQVTSNGIGLPSLKENGNRYPFLTVEEICSRGGIDAPQGTCVVLTNLCDRGVFLQLSNHVALVVDIRGEARVTCWRTLSKQTSDSAYVSACDFKKYGKGGLLALSTWEDTEIMLIDADSLEELHSAKIPCGYGVAILGLRFGVIGDRTYLFASLSDGTLLVHMVVLNKTHGAATDPEESLTLVLENIVKVSDGAIGLTTIVTPRSPRQGPSCQLNSTRIVTTGASPMLIYATRGRVDYVPLNMPHVAHVCNLGVPYGNSVPLLYTTDRGRLCVGEIDAVSQLHVETLCSGRTFDKICYHPEADLVVVGCLGEIIADSRHIVPTCRTVGDPHGASQRTGSDDGTAFRCVDTAPAPPLRGVDKLEPCVKFIARKSREIIHTLYLPPRHIATSLCAVAFDGHRRLIAVGTSCVTEKEEVPLEGHVYLVDVVARGPDAWNIVFLRTVVPLGAGIIELGACSNALIAALNDTVTVMTLRREEPPSLSHGQSTARAHVLEPLHASDSGYGRFALVERAEYRSCTYIVSLDTYEDVVVVGDLLNSVRMLRWHGNELREICKDFNSVYCTAVGAIDRTRCVASDSSGNFYVFAKPTAAHNDREAMRFEDVGVFHHGENINRIRVNPPAAPPADCPAVREMPEFFGETRCTRPFCCAQDCNQVTTSDHLSGELVRSLSRPSRFWSYAFNCVLTCVTTTGSLLQLCLFEDDRLFYRLALVEEAVNGAQCSMGNISNLHWRSLKNRWMVCPSRGFIDGDVVECFADLDPTLREAVFSGIRTGETQELFYSAELLALEVEHIRRLRR
ncbi:CPSF_A domain containing protein,putative [Babesia caballi]|uniref:CPSF_A domain containing protein,putative n=1 Tax=Babesia caballi TaxID=5871 RepID=A0AAV4M117_BABCB|nr:CPSF_A domain containing protein,putative [Babesia caballi]